ncbi:ABC transporter permease [Alteribacter populi]|uniref:ABC transporter permease n=1 Tax=Alteribacter populi TaxID=2011011 RepID=UPI000BBAA9D2|nr:ABC transporter permease subunit [Alteribacter populi]
MKQWMVLYKKEIKEQWRSYKWLWLPLVFIFLGIMQPVTTYYLPEIMERFGGMPDGAVIDFPIPSGGEVLAQTVAQFSQIGFLVLVLAFMGTITNERNQGTYVMVLVKPVSYPSFITSKWLSVVTITVVSYVLGMVSAVYYTAILIEGLSISSVLYGTTVFGLWLLFIVTVLLTLSTILKSNAAVAFLTMGIGILLSILSSVAPDFMRWSPGMLTGHSHSLFMTGQVGEAFWLSITFTVLAVIGMITLSVYIFKRKEVTTQTT